LISKTLLALAFLATFVAGSALGDEAIEPTYTVKISMDGGLGPFLVDGEGMTLYTFANDVPESGVSACIDDCAERWPPFFAPEIEVPPELNVTDFGGIPREDGTFQTTYKGWPLYRYFEDKAPGDVLGQGLGGVWSVVAP
jgi:predicted lipoprotein with Yx(FWY)xxD motif